MNRTTLRRTGAAGAALLALSLGLAACGDDGESANATDGQTSSAPQSPQSSAGSEAATGAGAETFGDGCSAIPTTGKGSFDGMVTDPVATAASNNPLLKTLVAAVTEAGLADTLNAAPALTVFAPTDEAFAKIPEADLKAVLADKELLTAILTHHVVGEKLAPDAVVGEHDSLNGDKVTVDGDVEAGVTVDDGTATVLCGNIPTANATVYVIDTVLMPAGM